MMHANRDKIRHKGKRFPRVYYLLSVVFGICLFLKRYGYVALKIKWEIIIPVFVAASVIVIVVSYLYKLFRKDIRKKKYLNSPLSRVDRMSGKEFEEYLQAYFEELGYRVELTQDSNDFGADLIMYYRDEKTVVQAKRYKQKVGIEAIQQIVSAKEYYDADKAMVVTNSYFTASSVKLAERCNVELWDRERLFNIKEKANG